MYDLIIIAIGIVVSSYFIWKLCKSLFPAETFFIEETK